MDSDDFLDDLSESSLTQEDWVRFFQLQARYMAPPEDPSIVRFTGDGQKIAIWLLNRYRTLAEMFRFLRERLDKNYVAKEGADRDLEDVSIEIWANIVARYANGYLQQRLTASVNAALKGVITEMYEAEPAIIEAALGQNTKEAVNPNLPSRADIRRIWSQIIDEHLDKAFVRENRGGDRRSERTITEDEKKKLAERVDALLQIWQFIVDFFEGQEYEAGCLNMLNHSDRFSALTETLGTPDLALIRRVFARKAFVEEGKKIPETLFPLAFALQQAAQEIDFPERSHAWRKKLYYEGRKLLAG